MITREVIGNGVVNGARKSIDFLKVDGAMLLVGTSVALVVGNMFPTTYHDISENLHFFISEVLMAFFFLIAAKEIRESFLHDGPLSNLRTAALPLIATLGGMVGPAFIYLLISLSFFKDLSRGWAIPMATDIAFAYLIARFIFGTKHPAIPFLLLLAIADDAGGLMVLAVFYPTKAWDFSWVLLIVLAISIALLMYKKYRINSFWWYLFPGSLLWLGFYKTGIHPALALVPLAWCMPHKHDDAEGFFEELVDDSPHHFDALSKMERTLERPVEGILGLFGFVSAGIYFSNETFSPGTLLVLVSLLIGKPLGIFVFSFVGMRFGLRLPSFMSLKELFVLGCIAGIGFTVAIFVSTLAFPPGATQDSLKLGALLTLPIGAFVAITASRVLGVKKV